MLQKDSRNQGRLPRIRNGKWKRKIGDGKMCRFSLPPREQATHGRFGRLLWSEPKCNGLIKLNREFLLIEQKMKEGSWRTADNALADRTQRSRGGQVKVLTPAPG